MDNWLKTLNMFILQSQQSDLKTAAYPKEWSGLRLRISFGMGAPARVPWIAFVAPEMALSKGFYPVYLYYKELGTLILAYGISETEEYATSWPLEIMNSAKTITAYLGKDVPRYGDSFVFKAYKIKLAEKGVQYFYTENGAEASPMDIEAELSTIVDYYKKIVAMSSATTVPEMSRGLFYMEKQLEDFIIQMKEGSAFCPRSGTRVGPVVEQAAGDVSPKSRLATSLLAILVGQFGVHRFYAGKIGTAVVMLLTTILAFVIMIGSLIHWMASAAVSDDPGGWIGFFVGLLSYTAVAIWSIVDFIIALMGHFKDGQGRPIKKWLGVTRRNLQ